MTRPRSSPQSEALQRAITAAGGVVRLADRIGVRYPAISQWDRVPALRVLAVESVTGISRCELRPDLYPAGDQAPASKPPPRTYVAEFVDADGQRWLSETAVDNGFPAIAERLAADELQGFVLQAVYELDLTDPLTPAARNMTAAVLGRVVDMIDQDDERDELPASLQEAARRHGVKACAEKAPRDCRGLDFLAESREQFILQVRGAL